MPNVLDEIRRDPRPGNVATWWGRQTPPSMAQALDPEEIAYLEVFTSPEMVPVLRVGRGIATPGNLTSEELERAGRRFGAGQPAIEQFVNYENRRRIVPRADRSIALA